MAPGDGFGQTEALMVNEGGVGGGAHLQLALPAVDVVCRLVQLLQFSLFTENTTCRGTGLQQSLEAKPMDRFPDS